MAETRFHAILRARVEELIKSRAYSLANGEAEDHLHYREIVGEVRIARKILAMCNEIEEEFN